MSVESKLSESLSVTTSKSVESKSPESKPSESKPSESSNITLSSNTDDAGDGDTDENSSDIPKSKHNFHITALTVFSPSTVPMETAKAKSSDISCSVLVTGLTITDSPTQSFLPMLMVHHIKKKSRSASKSKAPPMGSVFNQSAANVMMADLLSDPLPNPSPIMLSAVAATEGFVTLDVIGGIPLVDYACGMESGCMPEVAQIVPLAGGSLLAVTCATMDNFNSNVVFLLLFEVKQESNIVVGPLSSVPVRSSQCRICPVDEKNSERVLLACVSDSGQVMLYSCSSKGLEKLSHSTEHFSVDEGDEVTSCTYSPTTTELWVSLRSGRVLSVAFRDREQLRAEHGPDVHQTPIGHTLDSDDLENLLNLVTVSPVGMPFTCSSHIRWKEISLLQLNRRSPLHMNVAPEQRMQDLAGHAGPGGSGGSGGGGKRDVNNIKILQYEPLMDMPPER